MAQCDLSQGVARVSPAACAVAVPTSVLRVTWATPTSLPTVDGET